MSQEVKATNTQGLGTTGSAHTPGPWEISKTGTLPIHVAVADGRWKHAPGTLLASVGGNISVGTSDFQEDLANARLIAAAPDILDALKKCVLVFEQLADVGNYPAPLFMNGGWEFATKAIAKATGAP